MKKKVLIILLFILFVPFITKAEDSFESKPYTDLTDWLNNLETSQKAIDSDKSNKTATVIDEKEHIYRIDITTQSSLHTFRENMDLGFMLDVSNSMLFPSLLEKAFEDFPIYRVNGGGQYYYPPVTQDLNREKIYYLIGDKSYSATVFKIYFNPSDGSWYAVDASKEAVNPNIFKIGIDNFKMFYNEVYTKYPFTEGDDINTTYDLYVSGKYKADNTPVTRLDSLQEGMENTGNALVRILDKAGIAKNENLNPDIRIAYNTFNIKVNQFQPRFISIKEQGINIVYNTAGGTHTDYALGHPDQESGSTYAGEDRSAANFEWQIGRMNYGILFTDGVPMANGNPIPYSKVYDAATRLKNERGVQLITVGLGLANVPTGQRILRDIASLDKTGAPMFYSSENGTELAMLFLQIIKDVMFEAPSIGKITDTISEEFFPIDKETGVALKVNDRIDLNGALVDDNYTGYAGKIEYKNNKYQVVWDRQLIPMSGWHGTVYIKAKDSVHGENIPTNFGPATIESTAFTINGEETIELKDKYKSSVELPSPKITIIAEKEATEEMDISDSKLIKDIFPEVETVLGVDLIIRDENIVKIEDGRIIPLAIGSTDIEFIKDATKYTIHVLVTHLEADPIPAEPEQENPNTGFKYLLWILSIMIVSGTAAVLYWFKTKRLTKEVK